MVVLTWTLRWQLRLSIPTVKSLRRVNKASSSKAYLGPRAAGGIFKDLDSLVLGVNTQSVSHIGLDCKLCYELHQSFLRPLFG